MTQSTHLANIKAKRKKSRYTRNPDKVKTKSKKGFTPGGAKARMRMEAEDVVSPSQMIDARSIKLNPRMLRIIHEKVTEGSRRYQVADYHNQYEQVEKVINNAAQRFGSIDRIPEDTASKIAKEISILNAKRNAISCIHGEQVPAPPSFRVNRVLIDERAMRRDPEALKSLVGSAKRLSSAKNNLGFTIDTVIRHMKDYGATHEEINRVKEMYEKTRKQKGITVQHTWKGAASKAEEAEKVGPKVDFDKIKASDHMRWMNAVEEFKESGSSSNMWTNGLAAEVWKKITGKTQATFGDTSSPEWKQAENIVTEALKKEAGEMSEIRSRRRYFWER